MLKIMHIFKEEINRKIMMKSLTTILPAHPIFLKPITPDFASRPLAFTPHPP
jgi:hypothetical protein